MSAIYLPRAVAKKIVSGIAGLLLAFSLLYGIALLLEQQRPSAVTDNLQKQQRAHKRKRGKRSHRMRAVVHFKSAQAKHSIASFKARKKKTKKPKPVEKLDGQVVETARPKREERPQIAKYLGRYDMKVLKERKSKGRKRKGRDLGKLIIPHPSRLQSAESDSRKPTSVPKTRRQSAQKPLRGERKQAEAAKRVGDAGAAQGGIAQLGPGKRAGGGSPVPSVEAPSVVRGPNAQLLLPATSPGNILHNIQALAGNPGSDDYLPDVIDEGDTNLLNTRKFRYWDFFQRVKERVRSEWAPGHVWRQRDPTGKRYGVRDRLTVVRVTLDPDGALKQIKVARRSGLTFLDAEATRAFTAAGPYPNPPTGLKNTAGEVEFKFGFMFEISSARFRFYRIQN